MRLQPPVKEDSTQICAGEKCVQMIYGSCFNRLGTREGPAGSGIQFG
jgi:hypothetical protein